MGDTSGADLRAHGVAAGSGPMIAVCVAPSDLHPEVDDLTGEVLSDPRRADLSPAEAAAVEYGLQAAEAWGGWVLVVAAGPPEIEPVLFGLVALGAVAVRVDSEGAHGAATAAGGPRRVHASELAGDPATLAAALGSVIADHGTPAMVICGDRSAGRGVGSLPGMLAAYLGLGQALGLVRLRLGPSGQATAERRLDGGWREVLSVEGPAVLSVEAAGTRLRRAGLSAALAVETGAVRVAHPDTASSSERARSWDVRVGPLRPYRPRTRPVPAPEGDTRDRILSLTGAMSNREPPRVVGPLEAGQAADELLSFLDRHGFGAAAPDRQD